MTTATGNTVTTGTAPAANRSVVMAELRREIERQDRKRDSRNTSVVPSRVLLLRAVPEWLDEPDLNVSGSGGRRRHRHGDRGRMRDGAGRA